MGIPPFSINQSSSHHGREDSCGSPGSCCRNIMQHPQLSSFPLLSWTVSASLLPTSVYHPLQGYQQYHQPALPPQPYVQPAPQQYVQVPVVHQSSQFHAQDEFGNLQYGYNNINSVKHEVGNTYGGVR